MIKENAAYESIFIVKPDIGDEETKAAVEKFTSLIAANGTIEKVDEWGKKKLAYPIEDYTEGYYVLVEFSSGAEFLAELDRIYNITDVIIRSIIVRKQ